MAPNARPMRGPGGRRGMMGQGGPKVKNPGKVMARLLNIMLHYYGPQCLLVVVCILGSSLAMVQGTMFTRDCATSFRDSPFFTAALMASRSSASISFGQKR